MCMLSSCCIVKHLMIPTTVGGGRAEQDHRAGGSELRGREQLREGVYKCFDMTVPS